MAVELLLVATRRKDAMAWINQWLSQRSRGEVQEVGSEVEVEVAGEDHRCLFGGALIGASGMT